MLTFPIYLFTNKISKKNRIFLGGYPPYGPLKNKASQKWRPMTAHNPYFLLQNPILLSKWGCLQKTRPQYLKNWLSYSHIKFEKKFWIFFKNFEKIFSLRKIAITWPIFRIPSNFFSTWSLMSLFSYKLVKMVSLVQKEVQIS